MNLIQKGVPVVWDRFRSRRINVQDCPLIDPPSEVVKQGNEAILSYFEGLDREEAFWQSKMVIVGQGGVGKTCLIRALEGQTFDPNSPTTHGINIVDFPIPHPKHEGITMQLNCWDFGGQEIYHATHQFYLSEHALFVLVWSARMGYEAGKLYRWLETITALAPESPILVVATHSKERGMDLPREDLQASFPQIVGFFAVDNEGGNGISELYQQIQASAAELEFMGIQRPDYWGTAAERLAQLSEQERYQTRKQLCRLLQQAQVPQAEWEAISRYFHSMGEILYYPEDEQLKDTIILRPKWVSEHIAYILDSKELGDNAGFLPKRLMQRIWEDLEPWLQEKFLNLMEKFDLSYKTKDDREVSLVVEKLKYEEDSRYHELWDAFEGQQEIRFRYRLSTIPAGIPTYFIARSHRFSTKIHWRNGVLLQDEQQQHVGLVIARPEEKEVWLQVRGIQPYHFFAQLRDTLELTFGRFEGMKVEVSVPCPGKEGQGCEHFFKLPTLEKRLQRKEPRKWIECPEEMEDISVMKLLFGISDTTNQEVMDKLEELREQVEQVEGAVDRMSQNLLTERDELDKLIQVKFLKAARTYQEIMDQTCPQVFHLEKRDRHKVEAEIYDLHLYCQMPGRMHVVKSYQLEEYREFFRKISPYYNRMVKVLKFLAPLAKPGAGLLLGQAEIKEYGQEMDLARGGIGHLDRMEERSLHGMEETEPHFRVHGADLRAIRALLDKLDPKRYYGGLSRVLTPEGHILWLCKEHRAEYLLD